MSRVLAHFNVYTSQNEYLWICDPAQVERQVPDVRSGETILPRIQDGQFCCSVFISKPSAQLKRPVKPSSLVSDKTGQIINQNTR